MCLRRLDMCADWINQRHSDYTLLDAGCRTMDLKPLLKGCKEYYGSDLIPVEGVLECDLEKELPFETNSFDLVTVLDVLEHLNNPHEALQELIRVARKAVYVSLPNMYYVQFRWNFLVGKGISGKYEFPPYPLLDRHRWVMSYDETINFVYKIAEEHEVTHQMILPARGRTKVISEPIEKYLGNKWPNLFAYGALFEIKLEHGK